MMHLSKEQLLTLLREAKKNSNRDWLLFAVCYLHGLRITEGLDLTPADVRDGFITVQRQKGSMKTTQPLVVHTDELLNEREALERMCIGKLSSERIFTFGKGEGEWRRIQAWRLFQRYGALAGIPSHLLHPHILKASCGMAIISKGIEHCRQYLGHRSIASTGAYLKVSDDVASKAVQGDL